MDEKKLMEFVRRIIETSPNADSASQALGQLRQMLTQSGELTTQAEAIFNSATAGVRDNLRTIKFHLLLHPDSGADELREAADRARRVRTSKEMNALQQGRDR